MPPAGPCSPSAAPAAASPGPAGCASATAPPPAAAASPPPTQSAPPGRVSAARGGRRAPIGRPQSAGPRPQGGPAAPGRRPGPAACRRPCLWRRLLTPCDRQRGRVPRTVSRGWRSYAEALAFLSCCCVAPQHGAEHTPEQRSACSTAKIGSPRATGHSWVLPAVTMPHSRTVLLGASAAVAAGLLLRLVPQQRIDQITLVA